jgi:pimeloyl-ACP methyl ester carboxylesterase
MTARGATRTDDARGLREDAEFLFGDGQPIFGFRHLPLRQPARAGVVICSPVLAEFDRNYRREFALGRLLARDGFAVQRFHYRGTGNSGGDAADVSLASLEEDALEASRRLTEASGAPVSAVVGTRLGSFVAIRLAARLRVGALVLWEPLVDGAQQFGEAIRARLLHDLWDKAVTPRSREALTRELVDRGRVDVLGYTIHRKLYESLASRSLAQELGSPPPSVLIVAIGGRSQRRGDYDRIAEACAEQGSSVSVRVVAQDEPWWLGEREEDGSVGSGTRTDVVELTSGWIGTVLGREG